MYTSVSQGRTVPVSSLWTTICKIVNKAGGGGGVGGTEIAMYSLAGISILAVESSSLPPSLGNAVGF